MSGILCFQVFIFFFYFFMVPEEAEYMAQFEVVYLLMFILFLWQM